MLGPRARRSLFFAALVLSACARGAAAPSAPEPQSPSPRARAAPPEPIHHVVLITVDGMMPDAYEHPDAHGLAIPNLRRLVARGASSNGALSVFPSVTYPSHTSMVTGVVPGRHGIVSNLSFDPLERDMGGWRWYAEDIKREPVWRVADAAGYGVGIVHWPVTVGAHVSWLVPEYWRAKDEEDKKLLRALATPGLLEAVGREHPDFWTRYAPPDVHDDALTDIATHILETDRPNLLLLHLVEVDGEQHHHGVWSPQAIHAIENADAQIGRILAILERPDWSRDTSLIVASDHGFMNVHTTVRPGVLLHDAGLVTTNAAGQIDGWKASLLVSSASAYVYLHDAKDTSTRDAVREIFARKSREAGSGIGRVYEPEEIRALGGDPDAALAIEATPGFALGSGCLGSYVGGPGYEGTHGYDPNRPEMRASLILYGPNVPRGRLQGARVVDIAPTIAEWLGLPLPDVDGKPLRAFADPSSAAP